MSIADIVAVYGRDIEDESNGHAVVRTIEARSSVAGRGGGNLGTIMRSPWRRVLAFPADVAREIDGVEDELPAAREQQAQYKVSSLISRGFDLFEYQPASEQKEYPVLVRDFAGKVHACQDDDHLLEVLMRLDEAGHAKRRRAKMLRDLQRKHVEAPNNPADLRSSPVSSVTA